MCFLQESDVCLELHKMGELFLLFNWLIESFDIPAHYTKVAIHYILYVLDSSKVVWTPCSSIKEEINSA